MNLKQSQPPINSLTVRHFTELLAENRKSLLRDSNLISEITRLKNFLVKLDDSIWAKRSKAAAQKLSVMTEEERKMLLMSTEEKRFFLQYKKQNPEHPWGYFIEYQKSIKNEYK